MFMCVELMLNAVNLTFVSFARELDDVGGQVVVFFVLVVAAAEVVVGLGIIVSILRRRPGATADDVSVLQGLIGDMVELTWLIPALPLAGFLILLVPRPAARRAARRAGSATLMVAGSFVAAVVVCIGLRGDGGASPPVHPDAVHVDAGRRASASTSASWSTRCRSRCACSSPASPR